MGEERGQEVALGRQMEVRGVVMRFCTIGSLVVPVVVVNNLFNIKNNGV